MNIKRLGKIASVLFLCIVFLFGFSQLGVLAFNTFLQPSERLTDNTKVAGVNLSGLTGIEAERVLGEKLEAWKAGARLSVQLVEKSQLLDLAQLSIDIPESIHLAQSSSNSPLIINMSDKTMGEWLLAVFPEVKEEMVNLEALKAELVSNIDLSEPTIHTINLLDYVNDAFPEDITVAEVRKTEIPPTTGIAEFIEAFHEIEIKGHSQVSLLGILDDKGSLAVNSDELSVIASLLYELIFQTNFAVIERNLSRELPQDGEIGLEAKVDKESNMDFIFTNPNENAYKLHFLTEQNGIQAVLKGAPFSFQYRLALEDAQKLSPKTILQYSPEVADSAVNLIEPGEKGALIRSNREHYDKSGNQLEIERIAEDYYPPVHRVEMRSLKRAESSEGGNGLGEESTNFDDEDSLIIEETNQIGNEEETDIGSNLDKTDSLESDDPTNIWTDPGEIIK
ncbi:hypothetical protein [Lederbergia citrea]|uniref:hypothetical protein n=1 Tax=Lederbergia citrea TaxID=2833581 RepID=UPI001BC9C315|nr:hypothetical protein [Lederbergia citrea]MBS4202743.1 hypothetical protein [Lederbergia citrea]